MLKLIKRTAGGESARLSAVHPACSSGSGPHVLEPVEHHDDVLTVGLRRQHHERLAVTRDVVPRIQWGPTSTRLRTAQLDLLRRTLAGSERRSPTSQVTEARRRAAAGQAPSTSATPGRGTPPASRPGTVLSPDPPDTHADRSRCSGHESEGGAARRERAQGVRYRARVPLRVLPSDHAAWRGRIAPSSRGGSTEAMSTRSWVTMEARSPGAR